VACKSTSYLSPQRTPPKLTFPQRALETFYGIGPKVSQGILARHYIHPWAKVGTLKNSTVLDLTAELTTMKIENDLRREVQDNIRRLKDMGTYRGRRHAMGLPVRGQKTRTQVSAKRTLECLSYRLTMVDHDGEKVEQDRKRRIGSCADVRKRLLECIMLYCTAWRGVYWVILEATALPRIWDENILRSRMPIYCAPMARSEGRLGSPMAHCKRRHGRKYCKPS
jgi:small subunit ribosomal protein S13